MQYLEKEVSWEYMSCELMLLVISLNAIATDLYTIRASTLVIILFIGLMVSDVEKPGLQNKPAGESYQISFVFTCTGTNRKWME